MNRILNLQKLDSVGVEQVAGGNMEAPPSTCSWFFCGPSTASCQSCCEYTNCEITLDTTE